MRAEGRIDALGLSDDDDYEEPEEPDEYDDESTGTEPIPDINVDAIEGSWSRVTGCNCPQCVVVADVVVDTGPPDYPEERWLADLTRRYVDLTSFENTRDHRTERRVCNSCSKTFDNRATRFYAYCEDCSDRFTQCRICGRNARWTGMINLRNGEMATTVTPWETVCCNRCVDSDFAYCRTHNRWEQRSLSPCISRPTNHRDSRTLVEMTNYTYKPNPIFHEIDHTGEKTTSREHEDGVVYMGFELECEMGNQPRQHGLWQLKKAFGDLCYYKTDASLEAGGVEIVSRPMTLDYAHTVDWSVLEELAKQGWTSWDTNRAGIHVHVGRTAFEGDLHLWRFARLIVDNKKYVQKVAGRKSNYADFDQAEDITQIVLKKRGSGARYCAVNLQNSGTVEIRIFRGSLKVARLLADLEFVDAGVEYTRMEDKPPPITDDFRYPNTQEEDPTGLTWQKFRNWCNKRAERYPNLLTYMVRTEE